MWGECDISDTRSWFYSNVTMLTVPASAQVSTVKIKKISEQKSEIYNRQDQDNFYD